MLMPLSGNKKTRAIPAAKIDALGNLTEAITITSSVQDITGAVLFSAGDWFNGGSSIDVKIETKAMLFPALAKLAYKIAGEKLNINIGLGLGGYGLLIAQKTTFTRTYVLAAAPYAVGDVLEWITTEFPVKILVGGDLTAGASYKLSENLSIGANVKLGSLTTAFEGTEIKNGLYQISYTPAVTELATIKSGDEIGGINYGGGISLNLAF